MSLAEVILMGSLRTIRSNLSGETLREPGSPASWTSACSSESTIINSEDYSNFVPGLLAHSIIQKTICCSEDLAALGLLPLPSWVRDRTLRILLRSSQWRDLVQFVLFVLFDCTTLERDIHGDILLHTLAGIPGPESAALMRALFGENQEIILPHVYEKFSENINLRNHFENTPLVVGVLYNSLESVELLLSKGSDLEALGEFGKSALYFAVERNNVEIITLLLEYGARVDFEVVAIGQGSVVSEKLVDTFLSQIRE